MINAYHAKTITATPTTTSVLFRTGSFTVGCVAYLSLNFYLDIPNIDNGQWPVSKIQAGQVHLKNSAGLVDYNTPCSITAASLKMS
jgi:hypothetical protein